MERKILLVEDNPDFQEIFVMMAQHLGFAVVRAETGPEGALVAISEKPDVIVMDLMLPGADGIATTRRLKRNRATQHIPVVVCTALMDDRHRVDALGAGASAFLRKPIGITILSATLSRVLDEI